MGRIADFLVTQVQIWGPTHMLYDMHMQLLQMFSFKFTCMLTIDINNIVPRTHKGEGLHDFNDLITPISTTETLNVAVTDMMLSCHFVSKNSGAKGALIGDDQHINTIPEIVTR